MATRGRHSKDEPGRNEFTGRVRHWERIWVTSKAPKCKELKFRRWAQTDERPPELEGPRHASIVPFKDVAAEPYPKVRMMPAMPPASGGALPASAAQGAPGMKRGKSQHTMAVDPQPPSQQQQAQQQPPYNHQGGAAPSAPSGAPQVAAPAPKFKFKLTLGSGNKLQGAGGVASPPGAPPQDAAAGAAGVPPQQPSQPPQQHWGPT